MSKKDQDKSPLEKKKDFIKHLGVYLVFSIFFFGLNMLTSPGSMWWYWPVIGWGLGVALQYINVFGVPGTQDMIEDWEANAEEREIIRRYREGTLGLPDGQKRQQQPDRLDLPELKKTKEKRYNDDDFV